MSEQRWRRGGSRDRLLQAALRALADNGAGGVTGRAIARDADVHHAQIQQMFGSVDGLLTAAVAAERDRFVAEVFDATEGVPDPLAIASYPLLWRVVGQLLLDPGPIEMETLQSGGAIGVLIERLETARPDDDPTLVRAKAVAWSTAPLGALTFRDPLQRGLRIDDDDWSACWKRLGSRLLDLCEVDRLDPMPTQPAPRSTSRSSSRRPRSVTNSESPSSTSTTPPA